jgi:hypothetical protein
MSEEIVAEILRKVQALPRLEKTKFHVYKSRAMTAKKNPLAENDAIVVAAAKVGIEVGALLTPKLESVSTDEAMLTPIVSTVYDAAIEATQVVVNTDANTPITVLAEEAKRDEDSADEYGKLINFPSHDGLVLAEESFPKVLPSAALTPIQHNAAVLSAHSPAMTVSLKAPSIRWSLGVSADDNTANTDKTGIEHKAYAQAIVCAIAVAVCTSALVYYGAIAGGRTVEAWFWSAFCEISGFALVIAPIAHFGRKFAVRLIGLAMLGLGFFTMHTSIAGDTQQKIGHAVQGDSEVNLLQSRVERLKADLALKVENIKAFDPEKYRGKRERLISETESVNKELMKAEDDLLNARKAMLKSDSVGVASSWAWVEWLRRAALILVNAIAGHGLIASLGIIIMYRTRKSK